MTYGISIVNEKIDGNIVLKPIKITLWDEWSWSATKAKLGNIVYNVYWLVLQMQHIFTVVPLCV